MKMSDINENLSEAPEDLKPNLKGRPNTLAQRLKQKVKKHTPFSAKKRGEAEYKDKIFQLAKSLKNKFAQHMQDYPDGTVPTVAHMEEFFKDSEYEAYVNQVSIDLKFREEQKSEPEAPKDGGDVKGDQPELEKEKPTEPSEKEVRAVYKKQGEELEAERIAKGGELGEEVDEEDEGKPSNTSASIYESRLRSMLFELRDNEIDTLIVRIIQAQQRSKGGPAKPSPEPEAKQKGKDRVARVASDVPDEDEDTSDDAIVPSAWKKELFELLKKISKGGKLDKNDAKLAAKLYDNIN